MERVITSKQFKFVECPVCHLSRKMTYFESFVIIKSREGRCVTCEDKFQKDQWDIWVRMTDKEKKELDKIHNPKKVTKFYEKVKNRLAL